MKAFVAFWKRDIINKLIVFVLVALVAGAFFVTYLIFTMKSDSMFYAVFAPALGVDSIPTIVVAPTVNSTKTPFVFPTNTMEPILPTAELPTVTETPVPVSPVILTSTLAAPLPTSSPTLPPATTIPTQSAVDELSCVPGNPPQTGKVLDVIDGNTIKVLIDGIAYTVRYIGIDVPKYKPVAEYYGQEADFKNAEYVFAEQITLISDIQDKDDSGRLLRYVKVGDIFVNYELVRQGFAKASLAPSACANIFKSAEQVAAQSKFGMWMPTPTLPSP